ncbi:aspartate/glutamate racemase family protein, partial [Leptospira sp. SA-E8]|uniref:aspartate/glutamate racemase family protein n=1 Tax=Leptospira sp. SA-E8 TaxID=3422259 RepID=UPI003EBB614E
LRDLAACPVTGLAEAAVAEAATTAGGHGRFAIVTGGAAWDPMLRKLLPALAGGEQLATIETVALTGAQLRADPVSAQALLLEACRKVQREHRVDAIILGGAALGGLAAVLQAQIETPLIDSVQAAARHVWQAPPSSDQGCPTWL